MLRSRVTDFFVTFIIVILAATPLTVASWYSDEMQMFDLVEELKTSFYDFLGVSQTATNEQIKKAYRKLSVKMHPDKNPNDPEAEKKFRQLVGVYEALKDENLRRSYDNVLENGLPSWKSSVFYYRKLRKMSNTELCGIFFLLCTVVHYAVLLGSRFEKSLTLEDKLRTTMKAHKARDRKRVAIESEIANRLNQIPRPKWHDILPIAILKGIYHCGHFTIELTKYLKHMVAHEFRKWMKERHEKYEEKKLLTEKLERKRRLIAREEQDNVCDIYSEDQLRASDHSTREFNRNSDEENSEVQNRSGKEWTEDELVNLVHAISRFPGGTRNRWERIAVVMGRSVPEVTTKAKQLVEQQVYSAYWQGDYSEGSGAFETNVNAMCGESSSEEELAKEPEDNFKVIEAPSDTNDALLPESKQTGDDDEPYMSRKKLKQQQQQYKLAKKAGITEKQPQDGWTQAEQKQLEVAIRSIPRHMADRWDQIAYCVPTKTKIEVLNRVKQLSSMVKSKSGQETEL